MSNQALPRPTRELLNHHLDRCQNLGLILDKFAPWGQDQRGGWDLVMQSMVRNRGVQSLKGGEAKGLWLSTSRRANRDESPSLFEVERTDGKLMQARQQRWQAMVDDAGGTAFSLQTAERLVAGLGASHVLETSLTLERNTGLPYLPGSTVKGLARAWGLIEVAAQLDIKLDDMADRDTPLLNKVADLLISESEEKLLPALGKLRPVSDDAAAYVQWFRFIFGSQERAGAVDFCDAVYFGSKPPVYATDVMTPHYVNYYTESGGRPPAEDDNPNPVSFITVDAGNRFAFGLMLRQSAFANAPDDERAERKQIALETAAHWQVKALTRLGAGGKTAAGYGFFNGKSRKSIV